MVRGHGVFIFSSNWSFCSCLMWCSDDRTAMGQLVELKNGETYNGHLVNCDTWMNIHLREVICTSKVKVFPFLSVYFVRSIVVYMMDLLIFMLLIGCRSGCRMVIDFGGCQNVIFVGIPLSIFEFLMRYAS